MSLPAQCTAVHQLDGFTSQQGLLGYHGTFAGHTVGREYYFNDAGRQIELFGASLQARARGEDVSKTVPGPSKALLTPNSAARP